MQNTLTGSTISGFVVGPLVAHGGMGSVYRASVPGRDDPLAIKVILPQYADDPELRERFVRESSVMQSLKHANIMPVLASGEDKATLFFVMPFVRGPSVFDLLDRRHFTPLMVWQILNPAAQALDYAHKLGVVHRDIKPGNLLVHRRPDNSNHVYLLDFGLSKIKGIETLNRSAFTLGTPQYMAPEQVLGKPPVPETDVYSLGIVIYELLLGRLPFVAQEPSDIAFKHVNEPPPAPSELRPDFPKVLEDVLLQALEKKPAKRFQTAGAFRLAYAWAVEAMDSNARRNDYWANTL